MDRKYNQGVADANRRRTRHGATVDARIGKKDRLYQVWCSLKDRCLNPNAKHYHRYGGRGVTVADEWVNDFGCFRDAVGEPPEKGMTLDRVDNNRGYEPGNVRWATRKEQANNRATNVVITWGGQTMTLKQWADHLGWKYGLLSSRWKAGKRGADLFAEPAWERNKVVEYNGEHKTLRKWAQDTGVPYETLYWRHKHKKPIL